MGDFVQLKNRFNLRLETKKPASLLGEAGFKLVLWRVQLLHPIRTIHY